MENKKITIENYQQNAMKTCLPSARNWDYATFNYQAELFELIAKIKSFHAKEIRDGADFNAKKYIDKIADELGDCYWQIALICELRGERFHENIEDKFKYERYDVIGTTDYQNDYGDVENEFGRLDVILRMFDFNINEILQRNIDKLASRKERGVLKGNGDER